MLAASERLFKELTFELNLCRRIERSQVPQAERSFRIALDYWLQLKSSFQEQGTQADGGEIRFFKTVKPRFTSLITYSLLLHRSLLFLPVGKGLAEVYWQEEARRCRGFYGRNAAFIRYYESGSLKQDAEYFLQRNNRTELPPPERIYEDADCRSSHDHLVRDWLGNQLYHDYVQQRLRQLHDDATDD